MNHKSSEPNYKNRTLIWIPVALKKIYVKIYFILSGLTLAVANPIKLFFADKDLFKLGYSIICEFFSTCYEHASLRVKIGKRKKN